MNVWGYPRERVRAMKNNLSSINSRREKIVELVNSKGSVNVVDLVELLKVSQVTVRRDLDILAENGRVRRTFGGAERLQDAPVQPEPIDRLEAHYRALARRAAALIEDNDVVFINSSLTASYVLEYLEDKRVSVVTNNTATLARRKEENTTLIITGGQLVPGRASLTGIYATNALAKTIAQKCILGVRGISAAEGITSSVLEETYVNQTMIQQTRGSVIVVADARKIGRSDSFVSGDLSQISTLITDASAPAADLQQLEERGIEIIIAEE